MYEYETEAWIEFGFRRRGSQRPGFPSIVGAGPNSVTLHYNENNRRIEDGEMIVMDVGAEYWTTTQRISPARLPSNGKFTPTVSAKYTRWCSMLKRPGIEAVKPGVTMRDVHAAAKKVIDDAGFGAILHPLHQSLTWAWMSTM